MALVRVRAHQKVKKGDLVKVIAGKEKGKTGKVLRIISASDRVVVEHLNMVKRHRKPDANNRQGGIIEQEGSIHLSNVAVLNEAPSQKTKKVASQKRKKEAKAV